MKRGEVWTAAGEGDYLAKPRPAVIVQSDLAWTTESITVCPITTELLGVKHLRITLLPDPLNGLRTESQVMIDKISTVRRTRLRRRVGTLSDADISRLDRAMLVHLGLAGRLRSASRKGADHR